MPGGPESFEYIPQMYTVDLSAAWDSESETNLFLKKLKGLGIYSPHLLYSGFDEADIGKKSGSSGHHDTIFCSTESQLYGLGEGSYDNALWYAFEKKSPVVAVYDISKLEGGNPMAAEYTIKDPTALIAIIKLKGHTRTPEQSYTPDESDDESLERVIHEEEEDDDPFV